MIKLTALVENTTSSPLYDCKHGLCIYIETAKHKILFDVGPNDLFVKNAEKMGIDLKAVDTVVISHGHYDHGGGLAKLLEINKTAKVYVRENGFVPYFSLYFSTIFTMPLWLQPVSIIALSPSFITRFCS